MSSTFSSCSRESSWKGSEAVTSALDLVDLPLVERRHRDQVLGEHVERVLRDHRLLDRPFAHPLGDDRALEQVGAELGEDAAARDLAQRVAGAADPLQAAADRLRRLDLDHQVDGAHVDAQLQRRRRDQAGQLPRLQHLLDHSALLVGQRAVVGPGDLHEAVLAGGSCRGRGHGPCRWLKRPRGGPPTTPPAGRGVVPERARSPAAPAQVRRRCSSFRRLARRSAARRLLTKMIVELCSWTSFSSSG